MYCDIIKEYVYYWWIRIEYGNYMNMVYYIWKCLRKEKNVLYFKIKVFFGIMSIMVIMNFFLNKYVRSWWNFVLKIILFNIVVFVSFKIIFRKCLIYKIN